MAILSALLSEQRIIMVSENVSTLSECMHGVVALLYPFNWQQIFVPLLPNVLLDYLTAPMPFLIGIHASVRSATMFCFVFGRDTQKMLCLWPCSSMRKFN